MTLQNALFKRRFTILLLAITCQLLGYAIYIFRNGSGIAKTLWLEGGLSDTLAFTIDRGLCLAMLGLLLLAFWRRSGWPLVIIGIWQLAISGSIWFQGGGFKPEYALWAHANRYLTPLFLGVFFWQGKEGLLQLVLGVAMASTFATHGLEALHHNPAFIDLIIRVCRNWFYLGISEATARTLLSIIGVQDVLLAAWLLWRPQSQKVLLYMAFWGFITALSRYMFSPAYGLPQTLIRTLNFVGPFYLWLLACRAPCHPQRSVPWAPTNSTIQAVTNWLRCPGKDASGNR